MHNNNIWADELEWLNQLTIEETKNYQIWYIICSLYVFRRHREIVISKMPMIPVVDELEFLDTFILDGPTGDPKNYHAWAYRFVSTS